MEQKRETSTRKIERWENKKHKVDAFLNLVKGEGEHSQKIMKNAVANDSDEKARIRAAMRAHQKQAMTLPKFYLVPDASEAPDKGDVMHRPLSSTSPLFMQDFQRLLLYTIQGPGASYLPSRWCKLLRWTRVTNVIVVEVPGIGSKTFSQIKESFPAVQTHCPHSVEFVNPEQYESSPLQDLLHLQISKAQLKMREDKMKLVTAKSGVPVMIPVDFNRTCLILDLNQMVSENYPMPVNKYIHQGYKFSQPYYEPVTPSSPMFAVDCEMCLTHKLKMELTHIAVTDENRKCIYETYVKPQNKIINYLTRFSGITKETLANVTTKLSEVQDKLQDLLPKDAIWCGQSLRSDLDALKLFHPYVIDTSVIYNTKGERRMKTSLKVLTATFLGRNIQCRGPEGHNPVEDAMATMDLVLLKLKHGPLFGDVVMGGEQAFMTSDRKAYVCPKLPKINTNSNAQDNQEDRDSPDDNDIPDYKSLAEKRKNEDGDELDAKKLKTDESHNGGEDEGDSSNESIKSTHFEPSDSRVPVFFRPQGTNVMQPFGDILKAHGKKACVIAPEDTIAKLEDKLSGLETVTYVKRKSGAKACCDKIAFNFLLWTQLPKVELHTGDLSAEKQKANMKQLQKVDKSVKKITSSCNAGTLLAVLFPGQHRTERYIMEESLCLLGIVK